MYPSFAPPQLIQGFGYHFGSLLSRFGSATVAQIQLLQRGNGHFSSNHGGNFAADFLPGKFCIEPSRGRARVLLSSRD